MPVSGTNLGQSEMNSQGAHVYFSLMSAGFEKSTSSEAVIRPQDPFRKGKGLEGFEKSTSSEAVIRPQDPFRKGKGLEGFEKVQVLKQ